MLGFFCFRSGVRVLGRSAFGGCLSHDKPSASSWSHLLKRTSLEVLLVLSLWHTMYTSYIPKAWILTTRVQPRVLVEEFTNIIEKATSLPLKGNHGNYYGTLKNLQRRQLKILSVNWKTYHANVFCSLSPSIPNRVLGRSAFGGCLSHDKPPASSWSHRPL